MKSRFIWIFIISGIVVAFLPNLIANRGFDSTGEAMSYYIPMFLIGGVVSVIVTYAIEKFRGVE
jgi:uncharacterized membrane protein